MSRDWSGRRLHFIGVGGAGMSGLAIVAAGLGAEVTGSDRAESSYMERLRVAGLEPTVGHDAANLPEGAEVVVSSAIGADNPELALARERGIEPIHRGELLAQLCAEKRLIAVAGTHGKTTTTAMIVWALRGLGEDPAFFVGGEVPRLGPDDAAANAGWGTSEWAVAEGDESDGSFLRLDPEIAVVTNVEMDHHSKWGSLEQLVAAFAEFAAKSERAVLPAPSGPEVTGAGAETLGIEALRNDLATPSGSAESGPVPSGPAEAGGPSRSADDGAGASPTQGAVVTEFSQSAPGPDPLTLAVPGAHNRLNARAALAALAAAGFDPDAGAAALADFPGVRRRLELKGRRGAVRIYDDYAHHPTEVRAALAALRELEPARLVAVFQPHLYSRTRAFAAEFGAALAAADEIVVLDIYAAREEPVGELAGVSGLDVARAAADRAGGKPVAWLPSADRAQVFLEDRLEGVDGVLVTLGAGDVFRLGEALVEAPTASPGSPE
jgi:UDP-N-acetylmuramate--alanine ligase